jgi:hypothetical protein
MKKNVCRIVALVAVASMPLFASPPVPIAYSNEVKTMLYERATNFLTVVVEPYTYYVTDTNGVATSVTTNVVCYELEGETSNAPVAIVHVVTYGAGTNALFKLWSVETLPPPDAPWRNAEWNRYNDATWVTKP